MSVVELSQKAHDKKIWSFCLFFLFRKTTSGTLSWIQNLNKKWICCLLSVLEITKAPKIHNPPLRLNSKSIFLPFLLIDSVVGSLVSLTFAIFIDILSIIQRDQTRYCKQLPASIASLQMTSHFRKKVTTSKPTLYCFVLLYNIRCHWSLQNEHLKMYV
jgi:hypothetical protein